MIRTPWTPWKQSIREDGHARAGIDTDSRCVGALRLVVGIRAGAHRAGLGHDTFPGCYTREVRIMGLRPLHLRMSR